MCIDAETAEFHTENDCTYTLIHVPKQEKTNRKCKYFLSFKLSTDINVSFPLNKGTSVMFSGQYLTHRQLSNTIDTDKKMLLLILHHTEMLGCTDILEILLRESWNQNHSKLIIRLIN